MNSLVKIFFIGLLISLLSSLPFGTLNVAAMQISVNNGIFQAILFAVGALIVELGYVQLSLVAISWMRKQKNIFRVLEWITLALVITLAYFSFQAALNPTLKDNIFLSNTVHRFWLGALMCAVNPMQVPFWFGWSTVLFSKKVLLPKKEYYNSYIIGIGIGASIAYAVFIFGGQLIVQNLGKNPSVLNWIVGTIFSGTAIYQIWKMIQKKDSIHQLEHPEDVTHGLEKNIH